MGKLSGLPNRRVEREKTQGGGEGGGRALREGGEGRALRGRERVGKGRGEMGLEEPREAEAWDLGARRGKGRCKSPHREVTGRAFEEPRVLPAGGSC